MKSLISADLFYNWNKNREYNVWKPTSEDRIYDKSLERDNTKGGLFMGA